jgi:hypothetical protein
MAMQSTGQGDRHSSHPVHRRSITACMRLAPPTMASTGQAWMHSVQPMHQSSSISATRRGCCPPQAGSSGRTGRPVTAESSNSVYSPPGGQRLISAVRSATARA